MAIRITLNLRSFLVFNVYMPTDELDNLPDFTNCLARISAIAEESDVSAVYVLGDFNAHPTASFGKELKNFCDEQQWIWADVAELDISSDTFTFISEAHGSRRWLDHCITTQAAWDTILSMNVLYDISWSDHFPLCVTCNFNEVAEGLITNDVRAGNMGIRWGVRDNVQIDKYYAYCKNNLVNISDNFKCKECESYNFCDNLSKHLIFIDNLYSQIVKTMQLASKNSLGKCHIKGNQNKKKSVTGSNLHVQKSHQIYRINFET
nr:uncharacterized protein LOC117996081 [Maniola hyperantus]